MIQGVYIVMENMFHFMFLWKWNKRNHAWVFRLLWRPFSIKTPPIYNLFRSGNNFSQNEDFSLLYNHCILSEQHLVRMNYASHQWLKIDTVLHMRIFTQEVATSLISSFIGSVLIHIIYNNLEWIKKWNQR